MHLYCSACGVAWVGTAGPRCWLCGAAGLPGQVKITSHQLFAMVPLPALPGDTDDPVFAPAWAFGRRGGVSSCC